MSAFALLEGETLKDTFIPDRYTYWRSHIIMAVVLGALAGAVLVYRGDPWPVMGPIGAVLAIGIRGAYLASEALSDVWYLTNRRLVGPRGMSLAIPEIARSRASFGAVQVTMTAGGRHLMKYMADPAAVAARLPGHTA